MDDTGLEPVAISDAEQASYATRESVGVAESGAVDDDLARILSIWSKLTATKKAAVLEFVDSLVE